MNGKTHTFKWKEKNRGWIGDDWTDKVTHILDMLDLPYEVGNDAPKKGKEGKNIKLI